MIVAVPACTAAPSSSTSDVVIVAPVAVMLTVVNVLFTAVDDTTAVPVVSTTVLEVVVPAASAVDVPAITSVP